MRIGVPAEIKNNEHRVGLTPESVCELCSVGLEVNIQSQAGSAIGFTDQDYQQAGATILFSASDVYEASDLIVKVKEPLPEEFKFLSSDKTLFTYLHLAKCRYVKSVLSDDKNLNSSGRGSFTLTIRSDAS